VRIVASRSKAILVVTGIVACVSCSLVVDFDGYRLESTEPKDAGAVDAGDPRFGDPESPSVAVTTFRSYWFDRGSEPFSMAAAEGLAAPFAAESALLIPGEFRTLRGGGVDIDASGSFVYRPPGEPSAFWGDDYVDYSFAGLPARRGRARLTVQPLYIDLTELAASSGAGFGVSGAPRRIKSAAPRLGCSASAASHLLPRAT
jgi:hypothetical protein